MLLYLKYFLLNILLVTTLPSALTIQNHAFYHQPFDVNRAAFYKALEEHDKSMVNIQLEVLKSAPEDLKPAFIGAMLMKRAEFGGTAASKLHYFKEGRKMLESAIKADPENTEFRLLRLIIQEHAPNILGYRNNVDQDGEYIRKSYKALSDEVQQAILRYSKKSKFLKLDVS